jgi:DNA-3-methyladenine glycosylase
VHVPEFGNDALEVAPLLLGCVLTDGVVAMRIVEVEAYRGTDDAASHAARGRTTRNAPMFEPGGCWYAYFTYGMHWCINVVTGPAHEGQAVLLRAGELLGGIETLQAKFPRRSSRDLVRGPARLASAFRADAALNGTSALAGPLRIEPSDRLVSRVGTTPRIGITKAIDLPWRFIDLDSPALSGTSALNSHPTSVISSPE